MHILYATFKLMFFKEKLFQKRKTLQDNFNILKNQTERITMSIFFRG